MDSRTIQKMTTVELIRELRDWGGKMTMPGRRILVNEAADRLEALKSADPSPRILTLDELRNVEPGTVLWEMQRNMIPAYPVEFKGFGTFFDDGTKEVIEFGLGFEEVAEYGAQYILWTAKPTDEQIKAVKWDD